LALTSEGFRAKVASWISTVMCKKRAILTFSPVFAKGYKMREQVSGGRNGPLKTYLDEIPTLNEFGVLCKRLTCLFPTKDRVKFAMSKFDGILKKHQSILDEEEAKTPLFDQPTTPPDDWIRSMHVLQLMRMVHTLTRGWDETEYVHILQTVDKIFGINPKLTQVCRRQYKITFLITWGLTVWSLVLVSKLVTTT
jgi:hypothetical protein